MDIVGLIGLLPVILIKWTALSSIIVKGIRRSIKKEPTYTDKQILDEIWKKPVGQMYIHADLEYQLMEGYCAPSTARNIIKSIGNFDLPELVKGPQNITKIAPTIDEYTNGKTSTKVVFGSEGYTQFMKHIRLANDVNYRIGINFLRSPLFGFDSPLPSHLIMGMFGGHFSIVIGYDQRRDLVAIFDVNHTYCTYLVDAKRLFSAVDTLDPLSNQSRGLIVTQIL
ncbi:hypothetical protein HK103_003776 [Boothiomyces macroporosus]|uniref:glutathione gamma-glutamylcysteinyltransferase n=1 Tax=Boothiomyces macroporosus TaxID=261099 RepID=A0AAD5Y8W9_9FUNG|nr:hypothetical protein HK103_003776 [Boothiomyces macroporosus]